MAHAYARPENERLPWLNDDVAPRGAGERWLMLGIGFSAMALVAAGSFWFGMNGGNLPDWREFLGREQSDATIALAEPEVIAPVIEEEEEAALMPQVEPLPQPAPIVIPEPVEVKPVTFDRPVRRVASKPAVTRELDDKSNASTSKASAAETKKSSEAQSLSRLRLWPARKVQGASGRLVRIGTFASSRQAKRGWWRIVHVYPGVVRLKAVVVPVQSLRNKRTYYRLQFGTTSQAHSEVLCQRMRIVAQSCVVVGLSRAQKQALAQKQAMAQKQSSAQKERPAQTEQKQTSTQAKGQGPVQHERQPVGL